MKAVAVFPSERKVRVIDHPAPEGPGPGEVRVKVLDVGVCGTDREICAFEYGTPPRGERYLVLGHEAFGRVVATGRGVTRLKEGDLVIPMVRRPCAHDTCRGCRNHRQDFCYTGDFVERGIKEAHGFLAEEIVDDERYFHRVPGSLRDVGVLVEPLTIAEKGLRQVWQIQERLPWACETLNRRNGSCHRAVVLGAGPVGLLGAMALRNAGFDTWVYSRGSKPNAKAALVEAIGAHYVSSEETAPDALVERVGDIDVVYEAVGASRVAFDVMRSLGSNGAFIFTGVPGRKGPVELDTDLLMRNLVLRNQVVFGTVNAGHESFEDAIRDIEEFSRRWPFEVRALVTGRHPVESYLDLVSGSPRGIKDVIAVGE